ncbi:MAG TPA: sigma-70 family RNA polymerase sigma factor [Verrucomicrobiae bacterium]|jgi:RNA polymerase sigma factor for flagellar operon FliA|nr:sigma-70 family RNA polymerase sigma factor [Verrucomicrobiae bacterium]
MNERERTIRALMPIVRRIAKRISRLVPSVDLDDMIGDGSVGLIRAVDAYDPSFGTTLAHYAGRLILGKILNGIRRMDPVSERARREVRDGENLRYDLAVARGALPAAAEVDTLRPHFAAARLQVHIALPLSLDRPLPLGHDVPMETHADPALVAEARLVSDELQAAIATLPQRQRDVVTQHYFRERSLREIGRNFTISSQRASQLHRSALARLRKVVRAARD